MSNLVSGTLPKPAPRHDAIRALLRAGDNDKAIVQLCAITVSRPDDLVAKELLFDAFFQKREWIPALAPAEELNRRQPGIARLQKAGIATLSNLKRFDESIVQAQRYIEQHGEDLTILDTLKVAHYYTGKTEAAIRHGQRALDLCDAEASRNPLPFSLKEPSGPPTGQNVISFSPWGTTPFYSYGAMINLVLSRTVYPGWTCRFYVDATVPPACVAFLRDNGGDVRNIEDEYPGVGLFQRFLVMNDATVGRFLVRDCDARLSPAEADLVRQWILSDYPFHAVRDHVMHNELMIGCTWAGRTDCGIRYRRADAALFYQRADGQIRPRPAHAQPDAVAADPAAMHGPRPALPAGGRSHHSASRAQGPFRRRPPEPGRGAGRGRADGDSAGAVGLRTPIRRCCRDEE
jgi:tetratricopeptide (TPR) repeat protein